MNGLINIKILNTRNMFLILLFCSNLYGQLSTKFYSKYGGDGRDLGYGGKETFIKKQYIVIGSTSSFGNGSSDAYLFLIDSVGQILWQKSFGGSNADIGKSVIINPIDSGYIFTGFTSSFGNGGYDVYLVRTDKNGNLIWQSSFGGLDWEFGNDLTFSQDGNLIICGETYSSKYGKKDGYVIKVNKNNGAVIWEKKYGGSEDDELKSIKLTSDSKITIIGNTKSLGDINGDFWLLKLNNNGDSLDSKRLGNSNKKEIFYDFIEDKNANLVSCGSYDTSFNNSGKNISYIIKTNLNGNFISDLKHAGGFTDEDKFYSITNSKDGNKYFLSRYVFNGSNSIDIQPILIHDYNYNWIEATTYGGYGIDIVAKVSSTSDNGFLMIGNTLSYGAISNDVFVLKLDSLILNSNNIVSVNDNNSIKNKKNIFYNNNIINFENTNSENIYFQIFNYAGNIVQEGLTSSNNINLSLNLTDGLYLININKIGFLKFMKCKLNE